MFLPGHLRQSEHRLSCYVWDERLHKLCQSLPRPPCLWREARFCLEIDINLCHQREMQKSRISYQSFVIRGRYSNMNFISIYVIRGRYSKAQFLINFLFAEGDTVKLR